MTTQESTTDSVSTESADERQPYYRHPQLVEHAAPVLVELFEQRVYALLEETESNLPFTGLKMFKTRVLAEAFALAGGRLIAELVLDQMIKDGKLEVGKVNTSYSEFPTSTVKKA